MKCKLPLLTLAVIAAASAAGAQTVTRYSDYAAPYGAYEKILTTRYITITPAGGGTSLTIHSPYIGGGHGISSSGALAVNTAAVNIASPAGELKVPSTVNSMDVQTTGSVSVVGTTKLSAAPGSISISGSQVTFNTPTATVTGDFKASSLGSTGNIPIYLCSDNTLRLCCTGSKTLYARLVADGSLTTTSTCWTVASSTGTSGGSSSGGSGSSGNNNNNNNPKTQCVVSLPGGCRAYTVPCTSISVTYTVVGPSPMLLTSSPAMAYTIDGGCVHGWATVTNAPSYADCSMVKKNMYETACTMLGQAHTIVQSYTTTLPSSNSQ